MRIRSLQNFMNFFKSEFQHESDFFFQLDINYGWLVHHLRTLVAWKTRAWWTKLGTPVLKRVLEVKPQHPSFCLLD